MVLDDAPYFTRRALWQMGRASHAIDDRVADVHVRLSALYLERALADVSGALVEKPEQPMMLRIVA